MYALTGSGSDATSNPPGVPDASLDIIAIDPAAGTAVLPLAAGTVLAASPACQTVLVDHGNGTWVEYVHLKVSVTDGAPVTPSTRLGTVMPALPAGFVPPAGCSGLNSDAPHVHVAFLSGDDRTRQGQYLSMKGRVLCGYPVSADGLLVGLVGAIQMNFTVPDCGQSGLPTAPSFSLSPGASQPNSAQLTLPSPTPTPTSTYTPKPTPTPAPLRPPAAPRDLRLSSVSHPCPPAICRWDTVTWTALADNSSRVDIFRVAADPLGELLGHVVTCNGALAILVGWLKGAPQYTRVSPDYFFVYWLASSSPGATSIRFKYGGNTDYRGVFCGFYARAVNQLGASLLARVAGGPP